MPGFYCQHCGYDLSIRIDLLAVSVEKEYPDRDYPKSLEVNGSCEQCGVKFTFSGPMFTHYVTSKIDEGIINPKIDNYQIMEFKVSNKELEKFNKILEGGDNEELQRFIADLMSRK